MTAALYARLVPAASDRHQRRMAGPAGRRWHMERTELELVAVGIVTVARRALRVDVEQRHR